MDVIINLIIVLVIIASFMKRFHEAAQKGHEVKKPAAGGHEVQEPAMAPRMEQPSMPEEPAPPLTVAEEPARPRTLEDLVEQLERGYRDAFEPKPPPEPEPVKDPIIVSGEDAFEARSMPEIQSMPGSGQTVNVSTQTSVTKPAVMTSLSFSSSPLVNGLIMGEILGPPVSLRTGLDQHRLI